MLWTLWIQAQISAAAIHAIDNIDIDLLDAMVQGMDEDGMAEHSANQDQDIEYEIII